MVAAIRGYKCIFVMPDKMSRRRSTPARLRRQGRASAPPPSSPSDPRSYYSVSRRIVEETPAFYANQYHNPANPEAHYLHRPGDLGADRRRVRRLRLGMGTGGTLSAAASTSRSASPNIKIVGVDPIGSLYYDFVKTGRLTKPFSYKVEGIGEDFFPSTMNLNILDDIVRVDDRECFVMTRDLVRLEGIFVGGSCGAAVAGAIKYAPRPRQQEGEHPGHAPDGASKYISKIFNDDWMRENGFLDEQPGLGTVSISSISSPTASAPARAERRR
jgi:cystathionine beta-synthase